MQSTSGLSLSAFSLSAAFQTPDRRPFSTIDLTTNRRETRASSIYRLRHPSFSFISLCSFRDRHTTRSSALRSVIVARFSSFLCALTERSPATTFTVLAVRNLEGLSLLPRCCSSFAHRVPSNSLEDVSFEPSSFFLLFSFGLTRGPDVCVTKVAAPVRQQTFPGLLFHIPVFSNLPSLPVASGNPAHAP